MARDPIINFFKSGLANLPYSDTDTQFTLFSGDVALLPDPSTDGEFNLVIWDSLEGSPGDDDNVEIVRVTAVDPLNNTITVQRGVEGTTATTKVTEGIYQVILSATAGLIDQLMHERTEKVTFIEGNVTTNPPTGEVYEYIDNGILKLRYDDGSVIEVGSTGSLYTAGDGTVTQADGTETGISVNGNNVEISGSFTTFNNVVIESGYFWNKNGVSYLSAGAIVGSSAVPTYDFEVEGNSHFKTGWIATDDRVAVGSFPYGGSRIGNSQFQVSGSVDVAGSIGFIFDPSTQQTSWRMFQGGSVPLLVMKNYNSNYGVVDIRGSGIDVTDTGSNSEATVTLYRGDDAETNSEFLDLYNNGYTTSREFGLNLQKRGTGEWRRFLFGFDDGNNYNNTYTIHPPDGQNLIDVEVPTHFSSSVTTDSTISNGTLTMNGDTISSTGNIVLSSTSGDIFIDGQTIEVDKEMTTTDNIIVLNSGEGGAGITAGEAGLEFDRGTEPPYHILFQESNGFFNIGESGSLQAVATRPDSPDANGVAIWNGTNNWYETNTSFTFNGTTLSVPSISATGNITGANLNISNWNTAYTERGSQIAGTNLTWNGTQLDATDTNTNYYLSGLSFNTTDGVLTATVNGTTNQTVDLDNRYSLEGHTHNYDNYGGWDLQANGGTTTRIGSGEDVNFAGSGATSVARSGNTITISSTDTNTNTTYSAGGGLNLSGTTFSHSDTSTQGNVNTSGGTVIDYVYTDGYGHVTNMGTRNLDSRYASSGHTHDSRYVRKDTTNQNASFDSSYLVFSYSNSSNVDHIRSDDTNNNFHFCHDASKGSTGNSGMYANDFITTSDIRVKSNIVPVDNILDSFEPIKSVYTFDKENVKGRQVGLIAQEVEKGNPIFVDRSKDEKYGELLTLSAHSIASLAVGGVKELIGKTDDTDDKVSKLEDEVEQLKTKNKELERKINELYNDGNK